MEENTLPEKAIDSASVRDVAAITEETLSRLKQCYQCGHASVNQPFCGACGAPLNLNDYIAKKVKDQLADTIQNRDVLERESSIKVFKQVWDWLKIFGAVAGILLVFIGVFFAWKVSDFWSGVDKAKQSVEDTAKKSNEEIIAKAHEASQAAITTASDEGARQSQALKATMRQAQDNMG